MAYSKEKQTAAMCLRDAFGLLERAFYADPIDTTLEALTKVRTALDVILTPYYLSPDEEKEKEHEYN